VLTLEPLAVGIPEEIKKEDGEVKIMDSKKALRRVDFKHIAIANR